MLHAFFRAATLALLVAVAVLVYINYVHSSGPQADLSAEAATVQTPPALPKLAPNPEAQLPEPVQPESASPSEPVRVQTPQTPARSNRADQVVR